MNDQQFITVKLVVLTIWYAGMIFFTLCYPIWVRYTSGRVDETEIFTGLFLGVVWPVWVPVAAVYLISGGYVWLINNLPDMPKPVSKKQYPVSKKQYPEPDWPDLDKGGGE